MSPSVELYVDQFFFNLHKLVELVQLIWKCKKKIQVLIIIFELFEVDGAVKIYIFNLKAENLNPIFGQSLQDFY